MNTIAKSLFSEYIREFNLQALFNYLGWNKDRTQIQPFTVDSIVYAPKIIGDKNGFKIIECSSNAVPLYSIRAQILNILRSKFAELMVIFTDNAKSRQVWLYGYKLGTLNKKAECEYRPGQDPQALYERASGLFFTLDEEDNITIVDVTSRVRANFTQNAERVTKRFYDEFKRQHTALLGFITGVDQTVDKEWYASIMLNRLMFCYFMQRRGFLDNNRNYLRQKLNESKQKLGKGKFYSFYRSFLLTLFQRGFGSYNHSAEIKAMIGNIPYLNGGLFELHEIEMAYPSIDISDEAFERIFDLFDRYEWHLDTRAYAAGNEINPDVLGYIFEKYINDRAAMGAYYTQEDITNYISRSTILPYLLESTKKAYGKPFEQGGAVWKHLQDSGDKYIFDSVKKGANETIPDNISIGIDTTSPNLIERRKDWNNPVPDGVGLPTEIWREFIERTNRYRALITKISNGEITDVADFITNNLDIASFVGDLLDTVEDPKFVQAFYSQLEKVTILDPTCGSGAFLFAALNILEPLYDSCLSRMADYLSHDYMGSLERSIKRFFDEKLELMESDNHPNKHYFIYKSIILNNLYGVDIMKEAVETAKLRLFLKLVSTAEPNYRLDNLGIEPLPDIDFNLKAGNSLVGFANELEVENALNGNLLGIDKISETKDAMFQMSKAVSRYKQLQLGASDYSTDECKEEKAKLSERQVQLRSTLDKLLRDSVYRGSISDSAWRNNYQPFHWVSEFNSIIVGNGGFDVIIGNPPYLEERQIDYKVNGFRTQNSKAVHVYCIERAYSLMNICANISMIVPMALVSTQRMKDIRSIIESKRTYYSNYSWRPAKLFDEVNRALTIFVAVSGNSNPYSTNYIKWNSGSRETLLENVYYTISDNAFSDSYWIGKIGSQLDNILLNKLHTNKKTVAHLIMRSDANVYYKTTGGLYWKVFTDFAPKFFENGLESHSSRETSISVKQNEEAKKLIALLSSSLYWWWYTLTSNLRDLNPSDITCFRLPQDWEECAELIELGRRYIDDLCKNSSFLERNQKGKGLTTVQSFKISLSKPIIDQIDVVLATHYCFSEEELDYIINYDIKFRMGLGSGNDDEEQE